MTTDYPSSSFPSSPAKVSTFPYQHLLILIALAAILFFAGLGRLPLLEPDEGRNAEVAREMLASGDWITPHYNSLAYLDKPAVYFWLVAASFKLVGITEYAARMPSALLALGTLLLTWFLARRMFGDVTGLRAALIWATMPLAIIFARTVIFDMTLTFLVTLAMLMYWLAHTNGYRRPWLEIIMFASWGVATITKGPVGFLLSLLSILVFHALGGRFRELKRLHWGLGTLVFLAAALPWFIAVSIRNPDFPNYALWQESLQRFATGHSHRGGSIFYYFPVFLAGLLPWSLFLLAVGINRIQKWKEVREEANRAVLFALSWGLLIFVFFTISRSKLPAYFLPATVPFSLLMARAWEDFQADTTGRRPNWVIAGFIGMIATGGLIALAAWEMFQFASLRARALEKIDPRVFGMLKPSLIYTGLILAALGLLGRDLAERLRGRVVAWAALILLAVTTPALFIRWIPALRMYAAISSAKKMAHDIRESPDKDLPVFGFHYFRTSLPFYLERPVGLISADGGEMTSNYIAMEYAKDRQTQASGTSLAAEKHLPSPFENLLMDDASFDNWTRAARRGSLVLVRNNQVELLMETVPAGNSPESGWSYWQDSVWKIPPTRARPLEPK